VICRGSRFRDRVDASGVTVALKYSPFIPWTFSTRVLLVPPAMFLLTPLNVANARSWLSPTAADDGLLRRLRSLLLVSKFSCGAVSTLATVSLPLQKAIGSPGSRDILLFLVRTSGSEFSSLEPDLRPHHFFSLIDSVGGSSGPLNAVFLLKFLWAFPTFFFLASFKLVFPLAVHFFSSRRQAVLCDFSFSEHLSSPSAAHVSLGTAFWRLPLLCCRSSVLAIPQDHALLSSFLLSGACQARAERAFSKLACHPIRSRLRHFPPFSAIRIWIGCAADIFGIAFSVSFHAFVVRFPYPRNVATAPGWRYHV